LASVWARQGFEWVQRRVGEETLLSDEDLLKPGKVRVASKPSASLQMKWSQRHPAAPDRLTHSHARTHTRTHAHTHAHSLAAIVLYRHQRDKRNGGRRVDKKTRELNFIIEAICKPNSLLLHPSLSFCIFHSFAVLATRGLHYSLRIHTWLHPRLDVHHRIHI